MDGIPEAGTEEEAAGGMDLQAGSPVILRAPESSSQPHPASRPIHPHLPESCEKGNPLPTLWGQRTTGRKAPLGRAVVTGILMLPFERSRPVVAWSSPSAPTLRLTPLPV